MTREDAIKGLRNVADWHYGKYEQTGEEDYLNDGDFLTAVANMLKAQEPVYPTWYDWLAAGGLDPDDPIPADIAQKLGIEPKEE